jgi:hypothetical protein
MASGSTRILGTSGHFAEGPGYGRDPRAFLLDTLTSAR